MSNWPMRPLGDVAEIIRGVTFDKSQVSTAVDKGLVPVLRAGNIQGELLTSQDLVYVPRSLVSEPQLMRSGDMAICMSSGSSTIVGKSARLAYDWYGSVGAFCAIVRFNTALDSRYGSYWFKSDSFKTWRNANAKGANIQNLRRADLERIPIPVPPLAEQERIVRLLDEADVIRKLRAQADQRTAELIPSLFHDMFGDPVINSMGWPMKKLPELCVRDAGIKAGPFGSSLKKEVYTDTGPRVYGQEQVISGDFSKGNYHISESKFGEMSAYSVATGDVLISLVGTIGRIAIVPPHADLGIINPRLVRIRPDQKVLDPHFLKSVLTSDAFRRHLDRIANGGTMGVLNAALLKQLDIPCPPLELQQAFHRQIHRVHCLMEVQTQGEVRGIASFDAILTETFA